MLEYAFLLVPIIVAYGLACCVSKGIVRARAESHLLPLSDKSHYSARMLAAMCESVSRSQS
ncbi:MAG: hypothetical protein NTY38_21860, partial [Acidobacteria bacterium]|nr:hypothetical protein [Acidobacteriota bacterium]